MTVARRASTKSKDIWDKLSILASLISSVLIASVGLVFTIYYQRSEGENRRVLQEQQARQEAERTQISKVDLVAKLLPYLQSKDKDTQKRAYLTMKALGDTKLMTTLALDDSGPAAQAALLSVARSPETTKTDQEIAYRALTEIQSLGETAKSVLRIQSGSDSARATGFVWHEPNLIVTALHAVLNVNNMIGSSESENYPVAVYKVLVSADLALLKSSQPFHVRPLQEDDRGASTLGEAVVLGYPFGLRTVMSSRVRIETARPLGDLVPRDVPEKDQKAPILNMNVDVLPLEGATAPGESGAPVINAEGKVMGILIGGELSRVTRNLAWAVPAARLQDLLNSSERLPEAKSEGVGE